MDSTLSHTNIKEGVHDKLSHINIKDGVHARCFHTNIKDWVHDRFSLVDHICVRVDMDQSDAASWQDSVLYCLYHLEQRVVVIFYNPHAGRRHR